MFFVSTDPECYTFTSRKLLPPDFHNEFPAKSFTNLLAKILTVCVHIVNVYTTNSSLSGLWEWKRRGYTVADLGEVIATESSQLGNIVYLTNINIVLCHSISCSNWNKKHDYRDESLCKKILNISYYRSKNGYVNACTHAYTQLHTTAWRIFLNE